MTFGERVLALRTEKGMTQDELALAVGYKSRSTIAKIESGERDPHQSMIATIAKALDTTPAYLMGWEDNKWYVRNGKLKTGYWHGKDIEEEAKQNKMLAEAQDNTDYIPCYNMDEVTQFSCDDDSKNNYCYIPFITNKDPLKSYIFVVNNTKFSDYKDFMYPLIGENDLILLDFGAEPQNGDLSMVELTPGKNFFCRYFDFSDRLEFRFDSSKAIVVSSDDKDFKKYEVRGVVKQVIKNIK